MKKIILAATAFILLFALCACNGGENPGATSSSNNPAQTATIKPAQTQDGRGDSTSSDNQGDPGDTGLMEWWGAFWGQGDNDGYCITITEASENNFWFELSASDGSVVYAGTANINPGDPYNASYEQETVLSFVLNDSGDTIDLSAEDNRLSGLYSIVNHTDRYDTGERGAVAGSDPGDTGVPNWWGEFKGEEYSVGFADFDGTSFWFTFYNLRNGQAFFEGVATLYPDNDLMAEHGDISFYLYEDFNMVDLFASESSEWAHLRGNYVRTD